MKIPLTPRQIAAAARQAVRNAKRAAQATEVKATNSPGKEFAGAAERRQRKRGRSW